jgi:hypothetical protein
MALTDAPFSVIANTEVRMLNIKAHMEYQSGTMAKSC